VLDDRQVEVVAAEEQVAGRADHLEYLAGDAQQADVEGPAAEVVDYHQLVEVAPEAVGEGGGGGLVDEPQHLEPGQAGRLLGRTALGVGEAGRHRDDGLGDLLAELGLGAPAQVGQDGRRDLGDRQALIVDDHHRLLVAAGLHAVRQAGDGQLHRRRLERLADQALGRVQHVLTVVDPHRLGRGPHRHALAWDVGHHRRVGALAVWAADELDARRGRDRRHRVGGAEVDADRQAHEAVTIAPPRR
jgi:hypothetical protein